MENFIFCAVTSRWIVLKNGVIDSSILHEIFHLFQYDYHTTEEKILEPR